MKLLIPPLIVASLVAVAAWFAPWHTDYQTYIDCVNSTKDANFCGEVYPE